MVEIRKLVQVVMVLSVCASSSVKGIQVVESDLTITEGSSAREIFIRRQRNLESPMSLTVFVTTIDGYRQRQQTQCNIALSTVLGGDESQIDPAEDGDLLTREHSVQIEQDEIEGSFMLEVVDDNVAENNEVFIIYTSVTEDPTDDCARTVLLHDNDEVQFNFSRSLLEISEGEDLPSQLSIVKNGQNEPAISFQVTITPATSGLNENDYAPNADHTYVFTNETNELPIATQLRADRSGESIEIFFIYLPSNARYSPPIAESVVPSQVEVRIIDDDSLLIGFVDSISSVTLTEGGPNQTVCADIKPEGLTLDPFDYIPLTIRTESLGNEVEFGTGLFVFDEGRTVTCKTITAIDDNVSDGTWTSQLIIGIESGTSVPVEIHPDSIPITIRDNDVISFELIVNNDGSRGGPQAPPSLIEGDRTESFIRIRRNGSTNFAYNVTLKVEALTESSNLSKILIAPITMGVSDGEANVHLEILDNQLSEKEMKYRISIASIEPFEPGSTRSSQGALTDIAGNGIELLVYDNDFNVGFPSDSTTVAEEESNEAICVMIQGLDTSDISPTLTIPINITVQNPSSIGGLRVSTTQMTLTSSRNSVCFDVEFSVDNDVCDESSRSFTIQLQLLPTSDTQYTINLRQQTISIEINDAQDCVSSVCAACIAVPIVIILLVLLIILVLVIVLLFWRYHKHSKRYHPQRTEKRKKHLDGNGLESTDSFVSYTITKDHSI